MVLMILPELVTSRITGFSIVRFDLDDVQTPPLRLSIFLQPGFGRAGCGMATLMFAFRALCQQVAACYLDMIINAVLC